MSLSLLDGQPAKDRSNISIINACNVYPNDAHAMMRYLVMVARMLRQISTCHVADPMALQPYEPT